MRAEETGWWGGRERVEIRGRVLRKKSRNLVLFLDVETSYCRTTSVDKESMNVLNINPELKTEKR